MEPFGVREACRVMFERLVDVAALLFDVAEPAFHLTHIAGATGARGDGARLRTDGIRAVRVRTDEFRRQLEQRSEAHAVMVRLAERHGYSGLPRPAGPLIWAHAASVGETNAVLPLFFAVIVKSKFDHFL